MTDNTALRTRAENVVIEMHAVVSLTWGELTPRQKEDVSFLARQTYYQGRIDALTEAKNDLRNHETIVPCRV